MDLPIHDPHDHEFEVRIAEALRVALDAKVRKEREDRRKAWRARWQAWSERLWTYGPNYVFTAGMIVVLILAGLLWWAAR
jgi:type VI protein secretion system component VasF